MRTPRSWALLAFSLGAAVAACQSAGDSGSGPTPAEVPSSGAITTAADTMDPALGVAGRPYVYTRWQQFTMKDGLPNDHIFAVAVADPARDLGRQPFESFARFVERDPFTWFLTQKIERLLSHLYGRVHLLIGSRSVRAHRYRTSGRDLPVSANWDSRLWLVLPAKDTR